MAPLVYVETSIPGFYYEARPEPEMVARRLWTRRWWDIPDRPSRPSRALPSSRNLAEEFTPLTVTSWLL